MDFSKIRSEGGFGLLSKFYICGQKEGFSNNIFSTFKSNIPTQVTTPGAHPDHTKNDLFPLFNLLLVVVDSPHQGLHVHVSYTYIHALLCKLPIQYTFSSDDFFRADARKGPCGALETPILTP